MPRHAVVQNLIVSVELPTAEAPVAMHRVGPVR